MFTDEEVQNSALYDSQYEYELCPECGTPLSITQYTSGVGSMFEEAVCEGCGYTET